MWRDGCADDTKKVVVDADDVINNEAYTCARRLGLCVFKDGGDDDDDDDENDDFFVNDDDGDDDDDDDDDDDRKGL